MKRSEQHLEHAKTLTDSLNELVGAHEHMIELAERRRESMSNADPTSMQQCAEEERRVAGALEQLENQRLAATAACAQTIGWKQSDRPIKVKDIALTLPEDLATQLNQAAGHLRETALALKREQSALREAAGRLADHMQAILRQIDAAMSGGTTYDQRGHHAAHPALSSSIDLSS